MIDFSNQDLIYSILNGIPDGIVIYDLDLNVQYFNNAAARMLGKAPEALENMTAKDLMFDKEDNKLFQSILSDDSEKISFRRVYMTGPGYYEEA
ncbi:MAG: PAS domain-containing protein, partial [Cyclobacteriaceae bacterium]|nr:PAS domain-containing protein [Cyclobacteriaceae bacterium HetDA_MAG_MS6]